ncbi:hypothetical protein [Enterococcus entomosocium]|uniref:hypothetical protein n=1 Tax=Enterococcus entomosocium TaxID=3034352 RepID=UPI002647642D|nr:hypothetical protein [Enterococcus entomosocium]
MKSLSMYTISCNHGEYTTGLFAIEEEANKAMLQAVQDHDGWELFELQEIADSEGVTLSEVHGYMDSRCHVIEISIELQQSDMEFTISSGGMSHTVHTVGEALALLQRYSNSQDQQ